MDRSTSQDGRQAQEPDLVRWFVAFGVGAAATIGIVILVFLVSLALQPPTWVQIVLGVILAAGAAIFTWLVAKAWPSRDRSGSRAQQTQSRSTNS